MDLSRKIEKLNTLLHEIDQTTHDMKKTLEDMDRKRKIAYIAMEIPSDETFKCDGCGEEYAGGHGGGLAFEKDGNIYCKTSCINKKQKTFSL